ncbi:Na+/H+ antiporter NhaA [Gryllotalpicola kribbensis]|uniref:Na+/H+ antiporter NhaA n=1 Tax=Gryllotalpicola kribbensis TaxID=993084 RepID=UPI0031CE4B35
MAEQLRRFLSTESASSLVLVAAIVVAFAWANTSPTTYTGFWGTPVEVALGDIRIEMDARQWVSDGLMTLFFVVIGLEARREIDLGALRDRRKVVLPVVAGLTGMALPIAIFAVVNRGLSSAGGWGAAMSTDTALALGLLAAAGRNLPARLRSFLVTLFIVDDMVALVVIAVAYTESVRLVPLLIAVAAGIAVWALSRTNGPGRAALLIAAVVGWGSLVFSGVDAVVVGLAVGLLAPAYSPARRNLEEASGAFRQFREQPTARLARSAAAVLVATTSPNERLQTALHPWSSFLIVPLFALANAGVRVDGDVFWTALRSPVALGIVAGYVVGKPVAIIGTSALVALLSRGRLRAPVGWAALSASGTIAGVGFTVSILVASLAFRGPQLAEAKLGVVAAAALSTVLTWGVSGGIRLLPAKMRGRALLGKEEFFPDLADPVDDAHDHIRGASGAPVTVVEYGDFECPYCAAAERALREVLTDEDARIVWRHLPIAEVHPHAEQAALAAEAAAEQGAFWAMHDLLLERQERLDYAALLDYARELGLDTERFAHDLEDSMRWGRVVEDIRSADGSGASGTPTLFINGRRYRGAYDADSLRRAINEALEQQRVTASAAT